MRTLPAQRGPKPLLVTWAMAPFLWSTVGGKSALDGPLARPPRLRACGCVHQHVHGGQLRGRCRENGPAPGCVRVTAVSAVLHGWWRALRAGEKLHADFVNSRWLARCGRPKCP